MYDNIYTVELAGIPITIAFRHKDTSAYLSKWIRPLEGIVGETEIVCVPEKDVQPWIRDYEMKDDAYTEFSMSVYRVSDALLKYDRCLIHGAAMLWQEKAWLFVADSGTGKSTQIRHWKTLYPGEVRIINGDKPILKIENDGNVTVYPSPWRGKEKWGDDSIRAPLGGIILLKQGRENRIFSLKPVQYAARLMSLFFSSFETTQTLEKLCRFEESVVRTVPVWQLTNTGDEESAHMTHKTLLEWCLKNDGR